MCRNEALIYSCSCNSPPRTYPCWDFISRNGFCKGLFRSARGLEMLCPQHQEEWETWRRQVDDVFLGRYGKGAVKREEKVEVKVEEKESKKIKVEPRE